MSEPFGRLNPILCLGLCKVYVRSGCSTWLEKQQQSNWILGSFDPSQSQVVGIERNRDKWTAELQRWHCFGTDDYRMADSAVWSHNVDHRGVPMEHTRPAGRVCYQWNAWMKPFPVSAGCSNVCMYVWRSPAPNEKQGLSCMIGQQK